jgi:hypothetical protein
MHRLAQIRSQNEEAARYNYTKYAQQALAQGKTVIHTLDPQGLAQYDTLPRVFYTYQDAKAHIIAHIPAHKLGTIRVETNDLLTQGA